MLLSQRWGDSRTIVPKLGSLLLKIPDEFKPFAALGIGAFILVCLVLFHGVSLHRILLMHRRGEALLRRGRPHVVDGRDAVRLVGVSHADGAPD